MRFFKSKEELSKCIQAYKDIKKRKSIIEIYGKIEGWNVANITDFSSLFENIIFDENDQDFCDDLNLDKWKMHNAKDISRMFYNSNFDGYVGEWDTSNIVLANQTFCNSAYTGALDTIENWNVENMEETTGMFANCPVVSNLKKWKLKKIKYMEKMFYYSLTTICDFDGWKEYIDPEKVSMTDCLRGTSYDVLEKRPYWYLPGAWERQIYKHY